MSMTGSKNAAFALLAAALLGPAARTCLAQEAAPPLRAEFSIELDALSAGGGPETIGSEEGARRLLDEAAWAFAGMVWGFSYEYEPYDKVRGIAERFTLKSLGAIAAGDPRMSPREARGDATELRGWIEYRPDEAGAANLESYRHEPWATTQGLGSADLKLGHPGRRAACEDALREAVRSYLRFIEHNKPRRAAGRVVLERPPRLSIRDGRYLAQVRARIEVTELAPYVVY
jgi:hypothetical protein